MTNTAPDISPGYPSRGERIGPAWQTIWDQISSGEWFIGTDVAHALAGSVNLEPRTIKNLFCQAERVGILEKKIIVRKLTRFTRQVNSYRVALKNLNA